MVLFELDLCHAIKNTALVGIIADIKIVDVIPIFAIITVVAVMAILIVVLSSYLPPKNPTLPHVTTSFPLIPKQSRQYATVLDIPH